MIMARDIKFRRSILNLRSGNSLVSDTYWPISIKNYNRAGDNSYYKMANQVKYVILEISQYQ